jgi:hypothetical protein
MTGRVGTDLGGSARSGRLGIEANNMATEVFLPIPV